MTSNLYNERTILESSKLVWPHAASKQRWEFKTILYLNVLTYYADTSAYPSSKRDDAPKYVGCACELKNGKTHINILSDYHY